MPRIIAVIISVFVVFWPLQLRADHKPMDNQITLYVFEELFKDVGGTKTLQALLRMEDIRETKIDRKILSRALGFPADKAFEALVGSSMAAALINSGITPHASLMPSTTL